MNVDPLHEHEGAAPRIAAAIGDAGRARMLYSLLGNVARTSTELSLIAAVSPSTASAHLRRLLDDRLLTVEAQGKQRRYRLRNADIARVLEALSLASGGVARKTPSVTHDLRAARTCYDHIAGAFGVDLYHRMVALGWLASAGGDDCELTPQGVAGCESLGIDVDATRALRRRFAFGCLDWSERRPHLGGALGAALLELALKQRWVARHRGGRALTVTSLGRGVLARRLALRV
jgi:DNA-binding transcriptional ArsR family regulator